MRRAILLLAAVAAAIGLLLRFGEQDRAPEGLSSNQSVAGPGAESDTAAALVDAGAGSELRHAVNTWEVLVVDAAGAALPEARIEATAEGARLTAQGRAAWSSVRPTTWQLSVTADGFAPQLRTVDVAESGTTRTTVQLGLPCRVSGRVLDTRGERLAQHLVAFLQPTEQPPAAARELYRLPHAVTDATGSFDLTLPSEGPWRPIVVFGGRVLLEGARSETLTNTATKQVELVVPAAARLVVRLREPLAGAPAPAVTALSIYRQPTPAELARRAALDAQRAAMTANPPDITDPEQAAEAAGAAEGERDPRLLEQIEKQKRWRQVAPEGWQNIASSVMPEHGVLVLDALPHDTELRLALRRGDEVFRVAQPVFLPFGAITEATLEVPPPLPVGSDPPSELRSCPILLEPPDAGERQRSAGAHWL